MAGNKKRSLLGILLGNSPTAMKASSIAETYGECPYCVSFTSAGRTVIGVFSLPADHQWWLEWAVDDPENTLGLDRAEVFFTQGIEASSPWTLGNVTPSSQKAPCGAECSDCSKYGKGCEGCPATLYYSGT